MERFRRFQGTAAPGAVRLLILVLFLVGSKRTFAAPGFQSPARDSRRPRPCTTNLPGAGPQEKAEHAGGKVPQRGAVPGSLARGLRELGAQPCDRESLGTRLGREQDRFRGPKPFLTGYSLSSLSPPADLL